MPFSGRIEALMNGTWQVLTRDGRFTIEELLPFAEQACLRSFLLMAGEQAVAFAFCFQRGDVFVYHRIGYDTLFAKYSPGIILLHRLLDLIYDDHAPKYVDLGVGAFDYKKELANDILETNAFLILRKTPVNGILLGLYRTMRAVNTISRVLLERTRRTFVKVHASE